MAEILKYVNLRPDRPDELGGTPKSNAGPWVDLKARVKPARKGVPVTFEIERGPDNHQPSRATAPSQTEGLAAPGNIILKNRTDADGVALASLKLSSFGGDTFQVKAYVEKADGSKGKELLSDTYVVWRRIYYQVARFDDAPMGAGRGGGVLPAVPDINWGPVWTALDSHHLNIELEQQGSTTLIKRYAHILEAEADFMLSAHDGYDAKTEPVLVNCILCNNISDSEIKTEYKLFVARVPGRVTTVTIKTTKSLWTDESLPFKDDWLISAEWLNHFIYTGWQTLPTTNVNRLSDDTVEITLPASIIPPVVHVRLTYRGKRSGALGTSWYNGVWISYQSMYGNLFPEADKQQTTIHEIGHFLGQVPFYQSTHYELGGGHCTTGLTPDQISEGDYKSYAGTCVMYGVRQSARTNDFCGVCNGTLRAATCRLTEHISDW